MKVLQAGDCWAAGCCLHLLLTGLPPQEENGHAALATVSSFARELCLSLLRPDPLDRPTIAGALQSEWFRHAEMSRNVHRSQSKPQTITKIQATLQNPLPTQMKARLARHHSVTQLCRAVATVCAILRDQAQVAAAAAAAATCADAGAGVTATGVESILVPAALPSDAAAHTKERVGVADAVVAVDLVCRKAFGCMMWGRPGNGNTLQLQELLEIIEATNQASRLLWQNPLGALMQMTPLMKAGEITADLFCEFMMVACKQ